MLVVGQNKNMVVPCEAYIFSVVNKEIAFCNNTTHKQIVIAEYIDEFRAKEILNRMIGAYETGQRVFAFPLE